MVKNSNQLRNTIEGEAEILGKQSCDPLLQLSLHIQARQKYSKILNFGIRGGPREVIKAGSEVVESQIAGAFASPKFLSLD